MVEAASTSETLVNFYQTKRRYNPEDSHLRIVLLFLQNTGPYILNETDAPNKPVAG
jgi:hypothetical protein